MKNIGAVEFSMVLEGGGGGAIEKCMILYTHPLSPSKPQFSSSAAA